MRLPFWIEKVSENPSDYGGMLGRSKKPSCIKLTIPLVLVKG